MSLNNWFTHFSGETARFYPRRRINEPIAIIGQRLLDTVFKTARRTIKDRWAWHEAESSMPFKPAFPISYITSKRTVMPESASRGKHSLHVHANWSPCIVLPQLNLSNRALPDKEYYNTTAWRQRAPRYVACKYESRDAYLGSADS